VSPTCKPGSVSTGRYTASYRTVISLDVRSPARSSSLPAARRVATPWSRRAVSRRLFGLAPAGVCRAGRVATPAVGSYPTLSPLPPLARRRFAFCCTVRHTKLTPRAPRHYLATCPVEPGLSSAHALARARRDRPVDDHPLVLGNIPRPCLADAHAECDAELVLQHSASLRRPPQPHATENRPP